LFGSPFKQNPGASLSDIKPPSGNTQLLPYTNGYNWGNLQSSPFYTFIPTIGYAVKPNISFTAALTGLLYCGQCDNTVPLVYNGTMATQSWNLLANPFTSYLNFKMMGKTNLNNTLYLWDNSFYSFAPLVNTAYFRTYNATSNIGVPASTKPFIAPMQGFFVKAVYANPSLTFSLAARTHSTSAYYKEASNTEILVRLKTESDFGYDELVICKNADAKPAFEGFDSEKLFNDSPLEFYSQSASGEKLTINTINNTQLVIPLGVKGVAGAKAKITAFALESGEQVYLEDRMKGKMISLSENTTYDFEFPTAFISNRFFIRFGNINAPLTNSDIRVFETDDQLSIVAQTGEELQEVEVYSITGSCVFKSKIDHSNVFVTEIQLPRAMYLIKVKSAIATQNIKINWK